MQNNIESKKAYEEYEKKESERYSRINETINMIKNLKRRLGIESFGLVKGQHVATHVRKDPRTGRKFVAGKGGVGSPEKVLVDGKTVAPNIKKVGDKVGVGGSPMVDPSSFMPEESVYNPDTMQTIIKNLELATSEELTTMANDLFKMPKHRDRGFLAELMLKEVLRRGIPKSDSEKEIKEIKNQSNEPVEPKEKSENE